MPRTTGSIVTAILLAALFLPLAAACVDHDHCCKDLACNDFVNCCRGCQVVSTVPSAVVSGFVPFPIQGQCFAEMPLTLASGDLSGIDHPPRFSA